MEILQQQRHEFDGDANGPAHQGGEDLQNTEDTLECSGQLVHGIVVNDDGFREAIERRNDVIETVGTQSKDLTERIANGLKGTKQRLEDVGQSIKQKQSSALLGHGTDKIVHAVGGQQCAIVDPTKSFGYHVGGNLAGSHSGLEIAVLRNQIAERFAILGGDGVHLTLERIQRNAGGLELFVELHPSVVTTAKSRTQQGIASVRHRTDHRRDGAVVEVRPERPGFLEIAEHDLPRLRPTRTDGFLERIDQLAECSDVGCGVLRFVCHVDDGGGLILRISLRDKIGLGIGA